MNKKQSIILNHTIKNNPLEPIIVQQKNFCLPQNAIIIQAQIEAKDLLFKNHAFNPQEKTFIVIQNLETIDPIEQEKFVPLLKNRTFGVNKLNENTQILVLTENIENLSQKIKALCLIVKED